MSRPNDCTHLSQTEAFSIDLVTGEESPIDHYLCVWAEAHPERFMNSPRWLSTWALAGGPNFDAARHCPGCPGYEARR